MKRIAAAALLAPFAAVWIACGGGGGSGGDGSSEPPAGDTPPATTLEFVKSVTLTTDEDGGGARPEIVAYGGRFYIVYLAGITSSPASPEHRARTYASDEFESPTTQTLVAASTENGNPTDVRVVREGDALFTFWEQVRPSDNEARLFAAKYELGASLATVIQPRMPVASAREKASAQPGDELLNDPAPLFAWGGLFVMTRIQAEAPFTPGSPIYIVRELDPDTLAVRETQTLDLGDAMDGRGLVNSLVADGSHAWHIQPAFLFPDNLDLTALRMDSGWRYDAAADLRTLTSDAGMEFYPVGLRLADGRLYVAYEKPSQPGATSFPLYLKVFDSDFQLLATIQVMPGGSTGSHVTLEVVGSRVYVAYGTPGSHTHGGPGANVVVNVYEWR